MKRYCLLFLLLIGCNNIDDNKTIIHEDFSFIGYEKMAFNGDIAKITVLTYELKKSFDEDNYEFESTDLYVFKDGFMTEVHFGDTSWIFQYNDRGDIINEKIISEDKVTSDTNAYYKYDKNGNLISLYYKEDDNSIKSRYQYEYDSKGNRISGKRIDYDDSVVSANKYFYDKKDRKIKDEYYKRTALSSVTTFEYDKNQITESTYDQNGEFEYGRIDKYDKNGNIIYELAYGRDRKPYYSKFREFKYDKHNNMIEFFEYDDELKLKGRKRELLITYN